MGGSVIGSPLYMFIWVVKLNFNHSFVSWQSATPAPASFPPLIGVKQIIIIRLSLSPGARLEALIRLRQWSLRKKIWAHEIILQYHKIFMSVNWSDGLCYHLAERLRLFPKTFKFWNYSSWCVLLGHCTKLYNTESRILLFYVTPAIK